MPHPLAVQLESQPSPSTVLPSSQLSPASVLSTPSPHATPVQSESHTAVLGGSHVSPALALIVASPHCAAVQSASHVADSPASSHSSPAVTIPLPQPVGVQLESQPSPSTTLPSSQLSGGVVRPSPHTGTRSWQLASHTAVSGGSHVSTTLFTTASPQNSTRHVGPQPSLPTLFESSHCSGDVTKPSPQSAVRKSHTASHVAVSGGSHCSGTVTMPSPHTCGMPKTSSSPTLMKSAAPPGSPWIRIASPYIASKSRR